MSSHSRSPSPPRRASPGGSRSGSRPVSRSRSRSRTRSRSRSKPSSPGRYRRRSRSGSRSRSRSQRSQRSRSRSIPRPTKVDFLHRMMYSIWSLMILFRFMAIGRILNHLTVLECSVSTSRHQRETWTGSSADLAN